MPTTRTLATSLLPLGDGLRLEDVAIGPDQIVATLIATSPRGTCPVCGIWSESVHSQYQRTLADLPWGRQTVQLHLRVRKFFCRQPTCSRQIFTERLPAVVAPYARRTIRLTEVVRLLAFALGGEPGARIVDRLGMATSPTTLLRLIRRTAVVREAPAPRVLGVDDWAFRKGHRYGTILVDLERRRPVELLPDRSAAGVATWLREHPGVDIVSRDRAGAYADGVRQGAPDAIQVADRWHLLANIGGMLERTLGGHRAALQQAAAAVDRSLDETSPPIADAQAAVADEAPRLTSVQQERQARRAQRLARYEAVMALHQEGFSQVAISKCLGLGRKTIRRYLRADAFPEQARPEGRPTILARYEAYLRSRWTAGCHNAFQLWQEIRRQGFPGQAAIVRRYVAPWRTQSARRGRPARRVPEAQDSVTPPARRPTRVLSPHQARWLLLSAWDTLTPEEQTYRAFLLDEYPAIREAQRLADDFGEMVRTRDLPSLVPWLDRAESSVRPEIHAVAVGLRRDQAAVEAALSSPWSNGQTEGQVNKLKLLKRSMYGRANFDLLRLRLLHAA